MYHVPIVDTENDYRQIDFCHIKQPAYKDDWRKERLICLDHIKINVFLEGEFSVIVDGKCYRPAYGDICVLPPYRIHCGQISEPTFTDYYQLDIGVNAFEGVSGSDALMKDLLINDKTKSTFFRPPRKTSDTVIELCGRLEAAIEKNNKSLAYAYTIEILSEISGIYGESTGVSTLVLSTATKKAIKHIEENYEGNVKTEQLARLLGVSPSYLSRLFKKEVGVGVHEYLTSYRILQASYFLRSNTVSEVCYMCGFCDCSHFIDTFKKHFGCTPNEYRKRHTNG